MIVFEMTTKQVRGKSSGAGDGAAADPHARVLRQFRQVFNSVQTHFRAVEKRAGVGGAQLWALSVIRERPGIGVSELARALDIHQTTASNLVRSLIDAGLVANERNPQDRRAVHLRVLAPGTRVLKRAPGPYAGVLPEALERLDARTLKRLEADLSKLLMQLKADDRSAKVPLAQI